MTGLTPAYLRDPIPELHRHLPENRYTDTLGSIHCRTLKYRNSFYPDSVLMWNELGPGLRRAVSLPVFKKNLLKLYRPPKKQVYNIHDPHRIKWIYQLRVELSPLKSHKMKHKFHDTPVDTCPCARDANAPETPETSEHYFFHCPLFIEYRRDLLGVVNPILLAHNMGFQDDRNLLYILLYGHVKFKFQENQSIIIATLDYIKETRRFTTI